jgi:hypothetical protein
MGLFIFAIIKVDYFQLPVAIYWKLDNDVRKAKILLDRLFDA